MYLLIITNHNTRVQRGVSTTEEGFSDALDLIEALSEVLGEDSHISINSYVQSISEQEDLNDTRSTI